MQSSAPSQRSSRDGSQIHVLGYPYALRVHVCHARVCDGLVQSVQRLVPVLMPVQNSRDRTRRTQIACSNPERQRFVIYHANGFIWYLPPMFHYLRSGRHRTTPCWAAMSSYLRTYAPLTCIPASPLVPCKPLEKLDRVHIQGWSWEQLETFYAALFDTLQAFSLRVAVG